MGCLGMSSKELLSHLIAAGEVDGAAGAGGGGGGGGNDLSSSVRLLGCRSHPAGDLSRRAHLPLRAQRRVYQR